MLSTEELEARGITSNDLAFYRNLGSQAAVSARTQRQLEPEELMQMRAARYRQRDHDRELTAGAGSGPWSTNDRDGGGGRCGCGRRLCASSWPVSTGSRQRRRPESVCRSPCRRRRAHWARSGQGATDQLVRRHCDPCSDVGSSPDYGAGGWHGLPSTARNQAHQTALTASRGQAPERHRSSLCPQD
jgi:hypothetical protein